MQARLMIAVVFLLLLPVMVSADFEAVKDYRFLSCTQGNIASFYARVAKEQQDVKAELAKKYADASKKVAEHPATLAYELIVSSAADLKARSGKNEPMSALSQAFSRVQRLHYSVKADLDPYSDPSLLILAVKSCSRPRTFSSPARKSQLARISWH